MPFIIYLLSVAVFSQGTSEFMLAGLLPDIASDLEITLPQAGLLTSAFAVGMVAGAPLMAAISRKWPPRRALSIFLLVFIAMHVAGALTDSFGVLLATRVIAAFTNAGFLAVTLSTVSALVPVDRTARALAVILGGTTLALIAGVPAGAMIGALLDWRAALWGVAVISVPALIAVVVATPNRAASRTCGTASLMTEFRVLLHRRLMLPLVLCALVNGATFCAFTYLSPLVTDGAGLPAGLVPMVLGIFGIGSFLGVWAAGRFGDDHAKRILGIGGTGLLLGWIALAALSAIPVVLILLVLLQGALSFAVGSTLIAVSIRASTAAPTMSGSFATASLNIGAAVGPVLGGLVYATAAGATGPVLVSAGLILVAAVVYGFRGRVTSTAWASSPRAEHSSPVSLHR